MQESNVYIGESPIHGKGLFARNSIPAGTVIGKIQGELTTINGDYVLWISDVMGIEVQCHFRYINHSGSPNAVYYDSLEVCALRDIQAGEEITHNYQATDDDDNQQPDDLFIDINEEEPRSQGTSDILT